MIKDILKIHDKFSIEIKQSYYSLFKKKKSDYRVTTYLFIPNALNINEQTYSKDQFYKDIRANIRYNTPEYSLVELISNEKSPLNQFVRAVRELPNKPNKSQFGEVEVNGKIFATVFSSAIRDISSDIQASDTSNVNLIEDFIQQINEVLKVYRIALQEVSELMVDTHQKKLIYFSDEFISNATERQVVILYQYLKEYKHDEAQNLKLLLQLLKQEQAYKSEKYYDNTDLELLNHEFIIHKRSQLKKYVDSIFFLNKNIRQEGLWVEQSIFALVAGFAMLFSSGIALYYQQKYGNFTFAFLMALVVSYMLKDRIKGIVGQLFVTKANALYYDYKIEVLNTNHNKIGEIKENFTFVPFTNLGTDVKKYRFSDRTLNIDDNLFGEHIIQYKKRILLFPQKLGKDMTDDKFNSIVDITRVNLFHFTQNMDNPKKAYYVVKGDKIVKSEADRVYHINIIQKFYTESGIEYKRYRVVLNRNGIKRIEKVQPEQV